MITLRLVPVLLALFLVPLAPAGADPITDAEPVSSKPFGKIPKGEEVTLYTLTNKNGMSVSIMDYGATIVNLVVPDRDGKLEDIALGFDKLAPYLKNTSYFGATIGRYANRIAKGQFSIGRDSYQLTISDPPNSLHGGIRGFDKRMWKVEPVESEIPAVRFSRLSPDGEEGYPGNLYATVTFSLSDDNRLRIAYQATTDKSTIINLTNHTYFNLAGQGNGTILEQVLTLQAKSFLPVDATLIPTGEILSVEGTPWDFLTPTPIGAHLKEAGGKPVGFDHNYILKKGFFTRTAVAAVVEEPKSGRTLTITTDQPGIQFYSGNFLDGTVIGKGGKPYRQYTGFCLEPQHYPDSPNQPSFPSVILRPGETYKTTSDYTFGVK